MTQKVIFTREQALDDVLVKKLEESGFEVCHLPLIACRPNPIPVAIKEVLPRADWIFFTSAVAVDLFAPYHKGLSCQVATIGPQTSLAALGRGHTIAFEATSHYATDFVKEWLGQVKEKQLVLLPQSSLSNPVISEELRQAGHTVYAWPMYDTHPNHRGQVMIADYLKEADVLWAFASPSAWSSFRAVVGNLPQGHDIAVMGKTTAKAVIESGFECSVIPDQPSMEALVRKIVKKKGVRECLKDTVGYGQVMLCVTWFVKHK